MVVPKGPGTSMEKAYLCPADSVIPKLEKSAVRSIHPYPPGSGGGMLRMSVGTLTEAATCEAGNPVGVVSRNWKM